MTKIRFGRLIVLSCIGLVVACTSGTEGGTAGNTQLNLDIVNPDCAGNTGAGTCAVGGAACSNDPLEACAVGTGPCNPTDTTSCELGFAIDRVDYRITCDDGNPGAPIAPAQYTGSPPLYDPCDTTGDCALGSECSTTADAAAIGAASGMAGLCAIPTMFDDTVDITGQFETVDTRVPPVWQTVTDLPPGLCTVTLSVLNSEDEVACVGSQQLTILEDSVTKYDIVLVCSLSVDLPDGIADVDGQFLFITGNLCPKTYTLNAIPSTVDILTIPPRSEIQFRASDPDDGCGTECDPETCSGANPPVCTPSPYNPNEVRCLAAAGGGLTCAENTPGAPAFCPLCDPLHPLFGVAGAINPCCHGFDYTGVGGPNLGGATGTVCTIIALPTATPGVPGGEFFNPLDGTGLNSAVIPVNISDALNDGTDIHIQGSDIPYECDTSIPGNVNMFMTCSDGDEQCDSSLLTTITCPGTNFCDDVSVDCSAPVGSCITSGTCIVTCDPGDLVNPPCTGPVGFERCDGYGDFLGSGTPCSEGGGNVCNATGGCVECLVDADCVGIPATVVAGTCQEPNTCVANVCQAGVASSAGSACSNGICDGSGPPFDGFTDPPCQFVPIDPPATVLSMTLGCTNNLTTNISVLPWELSADPDQVVDGQASAITYTGIANFTESFLDAGLGAVPGLSEAALAPGNRGGATIVPKAGLIGGDAAGLEIEPAPIPTTCSGGMNAGGACTVDSECPPIGYFSCLEIVQIPVLDGTGDSCAACNAIGAPKDTQCAENGYCIDGDLPIPLDTVVGNYTAVANPDDVLIGWDETNQLGLATDGTYLIDVVSFGDPWQPGGLRVLVGILQISLTCVMAVDSGGPDGVGVPDLASPTPNSALLTMPIQLP